MLLRLGQLTGEMRAVYEAMSGSQDVPVITNTQAKTGIYSYTNNAATRRVGIGFDQRQRVRGGLWWRVHQDAMIIPSVYPFWFGVRSVTNTFQELGLHYAIDTGTLTVYVGGVAVYQSIGLIQEDTWHHLAFWFDGTANTLRFWVDDTLLYDYHGTLPYSYINSVWSGQPGLGGNGTRWYVDDFYVDESTGGDFPNRPPKLRFLFALPRQDGAYTDWTPEGYADHYRCVNETAAPDYVTFTEALSANLKESFLLDPVTLPEVPGETRCTVHAVILQAISLKDDASQDIGMRMALYDGITWDEGGAFYSIAPDQTPLWTRFTLQPDGSVWNITDFNLMQAGYRSTSAGGFP